MARPKLEVNEEEVEEIIKLKLDEVNGVKSKLTYNNVWTLNKKIAHNSNYKRKDGEMYSLYGYQFWASSYNGTDYLGKQKIDEIKSQEQFILAGKQFTPQMQDIFVLFDKYSDSTKSSMVLRSKLISLFEKDRKKIKYLEQELKVAEKQMKDAKSRLEIFQDNFIKMFFESQDDHNSLRNIMQLCKSKDELLNQELREMFGNKLDQIATDIDTGKRANKGIISREKLETRREKLEEDGF